MSFLLDTNICSAHMRRPGGLAHRFFQHSGLLHISSIALAELYAGAYLAQKPLPLLEGIAELLKDLVVLPFDERPAERFGQLRGHCRQAGLTVNPLDLMIAATAQVHDLTLVTHNLKDFQNIP